MFLSTTKIEENKAAGQGVAGRRMESPHAPLAYVDRPAGRMGILERARRRYREADA